MAGMVGRARAKYGIVAPATTGHPDFERANRVHVNTLENLIVFIPGVILFALYVSETWAALLGALFVVGRALYAFGYYRAADKRGLGAGISGLVNGALVIGGLIGLGRVLL